MTAGPAAADAPGRARFQDWWAFCDNARTCAAFGFDLRTPDADAHYTSPYLKLERAGGADAPLSLVITAVPELVVDRKAEPGPKTWSLTVDGRPAPGAPQVTANVIKSQAAWRFWMRVTLSGPEALELVAALRNGARLRVAESDRQVATFSLAGTAAALLWIDERQHRVGTASALVRMGGKPASTVPPVPALPLVRRASAAVLPTEPFVFGDVPDELVPADCALDLREDPDVRRTVGAYDIGERLANGKILWGVPCEMDSERNIVYVLLIGDEDGRNPRPVRLPEPDRSRDLDEVSLVEVEDVEVGAPGPGRSRLTTTRARNVEFDAKTQTLTSAARSADLHTEPTRCGPTASWVWDGSAFRLVEETFMENCFERFFPQDRPTLWRVRAE